MQEPRLARPATSPSLRAPAIVALALASAVLTVLAFPRYGAPYGLDHLIWLAPVPLFLAALGAGARRGLLLGWIAGMAIESAGFLWVLLAIRNFSAMGPVLSSIVFLFWLAYHTLPWALLGWALGRSERPAHVLWVIPFWVGVEHLYPRIFPWHLGGALYAREPLLQCADLLGASGLTALVLLVAATLYRLILFVRRRDAFPLKTLVTAALLLAAALVYGPWRLEAIEEIERDAPRLEVGLVQGNVDPRDEEDGRAQVDLYLDRSERLLARHPGIRLLVWPEGALSAHPFVLERPSALEDPSGAWHFWLRRDPGLLRRLRDLPVPLVAGARGLTFAPGDERGVPYNIAVLVDDELPLDVYRKNNRMPFGEVLPVPDWLRAPLGLQYVGNLSAGTSNEPFRLGEHRFTNLICYEAVLPGYVRRSGRDADFAVNITEDIWYGDTAHVPQHVSVLILRAVESRLPIVRCTNVGPSGVVRITGELETPGVTFEEASFAETLVPVRVATVHERGGYLFPFIALAVGLAAQMPWRRRSAG